MGFVRLFNRVTARPRHSGESNGTDARQSRKVFPSLLNSVSVIFLPPSSDP